MKGVCHNKPISYNQITIKITEFTYTKIYQINISNNKKKILRCKNVGITMTQHPPEDRHLYQIKM